MGGVATTIERTYELVMDNRASSKINATNDVLVEITQVVQEYAQFIIKYSEIKCFCTPPIPVVFMRLIFFIGSWLGKSVYSDSETTTKVASYSRKPKKLMQELRDRPIPDIQYGIKQLYEDRSSNCLA